MEGYLTIKEVAKKWGITPRRVQKMCSDGIISDAFKFGNSWAIPADTEKPIDHRIKNGKYKNREK